MTSLHPIIRLIIITSCLCISPSSSASISTSGSTTLYQTDIPVVTDVNTPTPATSKANVTYSTDFPFDGSSSTEGTTEPATEPSTDKPAKESNGGLESGWVVLIVVIGFVLLLLAFYFIKKYFDKQEALELMNERISRANRGQSEYEDPDNPHVLTTDADVHREEESTSTQVPSTAGMLEESKSPEIKGELRLSGSES